MKTLLKKSLLTSLCQREGFPLKKGGLRGLFPSLAKRGEGRFEAGFTPHHQKGRILQKGISPKPRPVPKTFGVGARLLSCGAGFTLVEVLISLVVLLLVSLALMQTALVGIDSNMINVLRDEAVGIAEMRMDEARNTAFDSLGDSTETVQRNIRNITNFSYAVTRAVTSIGAETRQVVITVTWDWKENTTANGNPYTHSITSIVRR